MFDILLTRRQRLWSTRPGRVLYRWQRQAAALSKFRHGTVARLKYVVKMLILGQVQKASRFHFPAAAQQGRNQR